MALRCCFTPGTKVGGPYRPPEQTNEGGEDMPSGIHHNLGTNNTNGTAAGLWTLGQWETLVFLHLPRLRAPWADLHISGLRVTPLGKTD